VELQVDHEISGSGGDRMSRKIFFVFGMLVPLVYIFMYLLGGLLRPGYNQISDSVSELLSPGAPNKSLLTVIQIGYALLQVLFGFGVFLFIRDSQHNVLIGRIAALMIIAVGLATIGTAIFPQDAADAPVTIPGEIHKILVFGVLVPFAFVSTLLFGIWANQAGFSTGFGLYSFISVGVIIVTGVLGAITVDTPIMGLVERIGALSVHQWVFVLAFKLFII
jgi:hypothetical protein